jgi:hypothetical protein
MANLARDARPNLIERAVIEATRPPEVVVIGSINEDYVVQVARRQRLERPSAMPPSERPTAAKGRTRRSQRRAKARLWRSSPVSATT